MINNIYKIGDYVRLCPSNEKYTFGEWDEASDQQANGTTFPITYISSDRAYIFDSSRQLTWMVAFNEIEPAEVIKIKKPKAWRLHAKGA